MENIKELVHVFMVTYNHEKFIAQAIESVLMQKTTFKYKIIIGEDCSTDRTGEIVKQYTNDYPDKIASFINKKNLGIKNNVSQVFKACTAKYIAMLEGDDYWTDPYKLQKQVDFLEENPEYTMCVHNAIVHFEDVENRDYFFNPADQKSIITTEDLIEKWSFATASMLFVASLQPNRDNDILSRIHNGDLFLALMVSLHGPIKYIPNVMSVYRRSIYAIKNKSFRKPGKNYNRHYIIDKRIELLNIFDNLSKGKYTNQIEDKIEHLKKSRKRAESYYRWPFTKYFSPKVYQFILRKLSN